MTDKQGTRLFIGSFDASRPQDRDGYTDGLPDDVEWVEVIEVESFASAIRQKGRIIEPSDPEHWDHKAWKASYGKDDCP